MFKKQPYSAEKGAQLLQAKRLVLHRFNISEAQWLDLMIETGCRFAEHFCRQFTNKQSMIDEVLKNKPANEDSCNPFWTWWRCKWMLDDEQFIKSPLYYDSFLSYTELKVAMIGDNLLESDLLQQMYSKSN